MPRAELIETGRFRILVILLPLVTFATAGGLAGADSYQSAEPQKTGWPLTEEERKFVLLPEHERRPGARSTSICRTFGRSLRAPGTGVGRRGLKRIRSWSSSSRRIPGRAMC